MLVLQRKNGEGVTITVPKGFPIPDDGLVIQVYVADILGKNRVRLAFAADKQVEIARNELIGGKEFGEAFQENKS